MEGSGKIAIFADLHYTAESGKLKGEVLAWAMREAKRRGAEAIVCAGDMIGSGRKVEAQAVAAVLASADMPVSFTPGNAELRLPGESAEVLAVLSGSPPPAFVELFDSSGGAVPEASALRGGVLLVTHMPPPYAAQSAGGASGGPAPLVASGHVHRDEKRPGVEIVRGLDPDKAQGGPPAFAIFERSPDGLWRRAEDVVFPGTEPEEWTDAFRRDFLDDLGISAMGDPFGGLDFALSSGLQCLELRTGTWTSEAAGALRRKIAEWRAAGGRILSIHLPELSFRGGAAGGVGKLREACAEAADLGFDRATLHVPDIPAEEFGGSETLLRDAYAEALAPLAGTGVAVGVENMHVVEADRRDWGRRRFGYTPQECARQIALLRETPGLEVGFHLDIGHARNNAPFSTLFPVGAWYEMLGSEINGMHIHQVEMRPDGSFNNHRPLMGFFDSLISLSSLVMARQRGLVPRAPMFIEVRDGLGPASWRALTERILGIQHP